MIAWYVKLALSALLGARTIACPHGFVLADGVRANGAFVCSRFATRIDDDAEPLDTLPGWIACARGTVPIVDLDGRGVTCRRPPSA